MHHFLVACMQLYNLLCHSVHLSVTLCFFGAYGWYWGYCSCPTAWLVDIFIVPAHSHATWVAVYVALFFNQLNSSNG